MLCKAPGKLGEVQECPIAGERALNDGLLSRGGRPAGYGREPEWCQRLRVCIRLE